MAAAMRRAEKEAARARKESSERGDEGGSEGQQPGGDHCKDVNTSID